MKIALASNRLAAVALISVTAAGQLPQRAMAQATSKPVIYLNQAWSQDDRDWYYHFSQGSAVLSYDIFLNLEVAGGPDLFRSDGNLASYGLIPTSANTYNRMRCRSASPRRRLRRR